MERATRAYPRRRQRRHTRNIDDSDNGRCIGDAGDDERQRTTTEIALAVHAAERRARARRATSEGLEIGSEKLARGIEQPIPSRHRGDARACEGTRLDPRGATPGAPISRGVVAKTLAMRDTAMQKAHRDRNALWLVGAE